MVSSDNALGRQELTKNYISAKKCGSVNLSHTYTHPDTLCKGVSVPHSMCDVRNYDDDVFFIHEISELVIIFVVGSVRGAFESSFNSLFFELVCLFVQPSDFFRIFKRFVCQPCF